MAKRVAQIGNDDMESGIDLQTESGSLLCRIRAYNLMACGRWDHNMEPADFAAIMDGLEMAVERLNSEICRRGL
tara:strand:- start:45 stop:266 length:222 start_codon:yes stop_codon:yes gene_type:complete